MIVRTLIFLIFMSGLVKAQEKKYLFFLHNRFTEENPLDAVQPEYGKAAYTEIIDRFKQEGFEVISEKRPPGTKVDVYALNIQQQITKLIADGVKPENITVLGLSKGGYIAQYVSSNLANPELNYIFIGCFQKEDLKQIPDINWCGKILYIYEKSDFYGVNAAERKKRSKLKIPAFKQIELNTGLRHGFLYQPIDEWVLPSIAWAKQN